MTHMTDAAAPARIGRRVLLAGAATLPLFAIRSGRAAAAEFHYRFATGQSPTNPINTRMQEAIVRIREATNGQLQLTLFPNNQLGSDTSQIAQVRAGALDFLNVAASVLSTVVPAAALVNVGFAFSDYKQVWAAADGKVGAYINQAIEHAGIVPLSNLGNNGFREISSSTKPIRTPQDLHGFQIRVPDSPLFTSLFRSLGASPTALNFNELYTALQTNLVGGEENGLVTINTAKLYEVQKYCAMTNHIWDGFCLLSNKRSYAKLPANVQAIVRREIGRSVLEQRADEEKLDAALRPTLEGHGMTFIDVDKAAFKSALAHTDFYTTWHKRFGDEAWSALEAISGKLG